MPKKHESRTQKEQEQISSLTDQQLVACYGMSVSHYEVRRFNLGGQKEWTAEPQDFIDEMAKRNMTAVQYLKALEDVRKDLVK